MLFGAALLLTSAISVTAAGTPEPTCPSPAQVAAALAAKLPDSVPGPQQAATSEHLRLELSQGPVPSPAPPGRGPLAPGEGPVVAPLQIELWDDADRLQLRRTLPGSNSADPVACLALAETIALIVDRYVQAVDRPSAPAGAPPSRTLAPVVAAPPAPAPDPPTEVAALAGASWRGDPDPLQGFEALAGVDMQRMARERGGGVTLTVGISPSVAGRWTAGRATLRRIPLRLGTYVSLQAGPGRLEPGLNLGIDALLVDVRPTGGGTRAIRNVSPNVEAAIGYRLRGGAYFARAAVAAGLAVPYRLSGEGNPDPVLSTPRTYIRLGLETGIYFR